MKLIAIQTRVISGQSCSCWLCIQIRYTRILFKRFWSKPSAKQGLHIYLFAPVHNPDTGYHCTRIGLSRP